MKYKYMINVVNHTKRDSLSIYIEGYYAYDIYKLLINKIPITKITSEDEEDVYVNSTASSLYSVTLSFIEDKIRYKRISNTENDIIFYKGIDDSIINRIKDVLKNEYNNSILSKQCLPNVIDEFYRDLKGYIGVFGDRDGIINRIAMCINNGTIHTQILPNLNTTIYNIPTLSILLNEHVIHDSSCCGNTQTCWFGALDFALEHADELERYGKYIESVADYIRSLDRSNL